MANKTKPPSLTKLFADLESLESIVTNLKPDESYDPKFATSVIELADSSIKFAQEAKKKIQSLLMQHHHADTKHLFALKGVDTGTCRKNISVTHELKIERKKKVSWDQEHLAFLFADTDVKPYLDMKFNVREAEYDKAPMAVRDKLDGGRTVTPSDPVFTIEEK